MQRDKNKTDFMDICFSLCMSLITVINLNAVEDHFFLTGYVFVKDVLFFMAFFCLFFASTLVFGHIGSKYNPEAVETTVKKNGIIAALIMWCVHLPYLIILSPGLMNYDTINQVNDVFNGVSPVPFGFVEGQETVNVFLNAHHPVAISFLFAAFIKIGYILGDPGKGLFIYCLLQSLVACFIISGILTDIENSTSDKAALKTVKGVRLFFMFMPFIPYYTMCMLKNTVHSLIFILFIYVYYKYLKNDGIFNARNIGIFLVISVLMCISQNTGVYTVLITCILHALFNRKNRLIFLADICLCVILWFIIVPKIIYPAANIFPGGKQEMLGTCFQQTARLVRDKEEELTEEDKEIISRVLDYEKIKSDYDFSTSDPVKATYNLHVSKEDLNAYLVFWLKNGFKHPIIYLRAILPICGNFFAPISSVQIFDQIPQSEGVFENVAQVRPQKLWMGLRDWYYGLRDMPGINILFQVVVYSFWIPAYLFYYFVIRKKDRGGENGWGVNWVFVPLFVNILMLIVSPMNYSRYALPLLFASPICLCMFMSSKK